ncbi:MAG: radical SAM protein [Desulfovibrio sp.]|jgi:tRNA A37 methylthiotransferase MiaB|nr:radical SAM protein [Desulfovibrio sp.]
MRGDSFLIFNMGCKINRYEGQALREAWLGLGMTEADGVERADVIVLNSCAVTAAAEADLRSSLRRFARLAPRAGIIVTGCAAKLPGAASLPGIRRLVEQNDKASLLRGPWADPGLEVFPAPGLDDLSCAPARTRGEKGKGFPPPADFRAQGARGIQSAGSGGRDAFPGFALSSCERSRAAIKIQDGCSQGCAYCIVPLVRGKARSRPFPETLAEARRLLRTGFRELVISGVNLRQYNDGGDDFWDFLARLEEALAPEWAGRMRLRLSSLEPGQLGDKALRVIAQSGLLAPHLHLSLQSGSLGVLRRMGRAFCDLQALPGFLDRLGLIWPRFALGADLLVAFPGETEAEFLENLDFVRALPLSYAHVFPYSRRPGTAAADMPGQVGAGARKERAAKLRALAGEKKTAFLHGLLEEETLRVVFENNRGGGCLGVCEYYADCVLADARGRPEPRVLTPVSPLGVEGEKLLVRAQPEGV